MCGFAGILTDSLLHFDIDIITYRMLDSIKHRGPDDSKIWSQKNVCFGFNRLSIIDINESGSQPMMSPNKDFVIVFNGEIYNYVELKLELIELGEVFYSTSDTEVLLRLYILYGKNMLSKLNGMFAFAIYDIKKNSMFFARDRLGKKPMFFFNDNNGLFSFASEIKSFYHLPSFSKELDSSSLTMYFKYGYVPTDFCVFKNVFKLPPASYLELDLSEGLISIIDKIEFKKYWDLEYVLNNTSHLSTLSFSKLFKNAVDIRLRSDVGFSGFLSSGIDSSLVALNLSKISGKDSKVVTVVGEGVYDESITAANTASLLDLTHEVINMDSVTLELIDDLSSHFDEPFADMSMVSTFLCCNAMQKSAKVALSGDGGDEAFGGYPEFIKVCTYNFIFLIPDSLRRRIFRCLAYCFGNDSRLRRLFKLFSLPRKIAYFTITKNLFEDWQSTTLKKDYQISDYDMLDYLKNLNFKFAGTPLQIAQTGAILYNLIDDMLVKVDRMSMRASLEVRSPFLDYRVIEYGLRLKDSEKVRNKISKAILRDEIDREIPGGLSQLPKRGFSVPTVSWLTDEVFGKDIYIRLLSWTVHQSCPYTASGLEKIWEDAKKNKALIPPLYRLICYYFWYNFNIEKIQ